MNNLYNQSDVSEILNRIEKLSSNSQRQWGKMNVGQMLSHLNTFLETALNLNSPKGLLIGRILGPFFKLSYVSEKQFLRIHQHIKTIFLLIFENLKRRKQNQSN